LSMDIVLKLVFSPYIWPVFNGGGPGKLAPYF
jgi:hypothetical protein